MFALVCPKCGGPVPGGSTAHELTCSYCSVTLVREAASFEVAEGSIAQPTEASRQGRWRLQEALQKGLGEGSPLELLRGALREEMGMGEEAEVVAKIVDALAREFERESKVKVRHDPISVCRLAITYLEAVEELAQHDEAALEIPFFAASSSGPVHFKRSLTVADVQRLAAPDKPVVTPAPAAPPPARVEPEPAEASPPQEPPKRWWWPF